MAWIGSKSKNFQRPQTPSYSQHLHVQGPAYKKWPRTPKFENRHCRQNTFDLSVDESMLPYFGRNSSKQRMQNIHVQSCYKMWVLAESNGYVINFDPYQGAKNGKKHHSSEISWGLGETVVLSLLDVMLENIGYHVFIDNVSTSFRLIQHLASNNIRASGKIRPNRLGKCTATATKAAIDKFKQGEMDFRTAKSEDLIVVGWKDNKSVYLASNCDSVNPVSSAERWNRVVEAKVLVPQPHLI